MDANQRRLQDASITTLAALAAVDPGKVKVAGVSAKRLTQWAIMAS